MKFTCLNLLHYSIKVNPSGLCNIKTTEVVEQNKCTTVGHSLNSTGIGVLHDVIKDVERKKERKK